MLVTKVSPSTPLKLMSVLLSATVGLSACGGGSGLESTPAEGQPTATTVANAEIASVIANSGDLEAIPSYIGTEIREVESISAVATLPSVYTPAHIRAAYKLPALPASYSNLTPSAAAALGAGQTIYIVGSYHNPNMLTDLNAFSSKYGLPTCTNVPVTTAVSLPSPNSYGGLLYIGNNTQRNRMAPARTTGCDVVTVYTKTGWISNIPPANSTTWGMESALDTQWAHAIAPLARIVVIEALNTFGNELIQGVMAANSFGPGAVSMSWLMNEWYLEHTWETFFNVPGMTYLSASGDRGTQANWPAVSPSVIAVGGTKLQFDGAGLRSEIGWTKSGGGYSAFLPKPSYQSAIATPPTVTGKYANTAFANQGVRAVPDVAMNSDPATGQFVQFTPAGGITSFYKMGGTSVATPMWAGIVTSANATRALNGKAALGKFHGNLYKGSFATGLLDITSGNNGTAATVGFDTVTGMGTPQVDYLMLGFASN